jgi:hypothetical protein
MATLSCHIAVSMPTVPGRHSKQGWLDSRGQQVDLLMRVRTTAA